MPLVSSGDVLLPRFFERIDKVTCEGLEAGRRDGPPFPGSYGTLGRILDGGCLSILGDT